MSPYHDEDWQDLNAREQKRTDMDTPKPAALSDEELANARLTAAFYEDKLLLRLIATIDAREAERDALKAELATARATPPADALVEALIEARGMIESWGAYAPDYFKEKWGLSDDLEKIDNVIRTAHKGNDNG